jgi:SAM-dependent methyltransferase
VWRLCVGGALVDLPCGRGGYGLEIAARRGAQPVGVGFSAEAVRQARRLGTGAADAVLCVDAIHFAAEPSVGYSEIQQIPTSGGRAVLTCWEPLGQDGGGLPGRLRRVDLGARLGRIT